MALLNIKGYRCTECGGLFHKRDGSGFVPWKWICHRCRSAIAAEKRAAKTKTK